MVREVSARNASNAKLSNSNHSGGGIEATGGSNLWFESSNIDVSGFSLSAALGSHIESNAFTNITAGSPVSLSNYSTFQLEDTDLGNAGIVCQSQTNQVVQVAGVTSIGSLVNCP